MQIAQLCGRWINSSPNTNSIAVIKATDSDGHLQLQISAVGPDGFIDWGSYFVREYFAVTHDRFLKGNS